MTFIREEPGAVGIVPFARRLEEAGLLPLVALSVEILQINTGRRCNLSCKHCHLDAGPCRNESMSREVFGKCLEIASAPFVKVIDITGGAPEMNPELPRFLEKASTLRKRLIVRSNLAILNEAPYSTFIDLYARAGVEVVGSLPALTGAQTDKQRGSGVYDAAIAVIRKLNERGYGMQDSGLTLDLVHNPVGAFLPGSQKALEQEYKKRLFDMHGIRFNTLYCLTNNPLGRYRSYLIQSGNYEEYMDSLACAFNIAAAENVMCRSTISVGWDGRLYDCDFNQALDLPVKGGTSMNVNSFDPDALKKREIVVADHCYACTAGSGSSCQGVIDG